MKRSVALEKQVRRRPRPGVIPACQHLADDTSGGSSLPMTGRRVAPLLGANDTGGQCAPGSSGDAHPSPAARRDSAMTYVLATRPAVAGRDARTVTGATPI